MDILIFLNNTIKARRAVVKKMLGFYQVKPNIFRGIEGRILRYFLYFFDPSFFWRFCSWNLKAPFEQGSKPLKKQLSKDNLQ
jgi:hypothetical protein